jgi:flagellar motility protein MotE (MotC chaperone)
MKIRFLPILIIISILVFFTKITGIYQLSNQYFKDIFTLNVSLAQAEAPEGRKKEVKPEYVVSKEKPENINPQQNSQFDATEIDILQNLAKRRQEIDNWAKEVSTKEAVLKSAQDQLDQKIATLAKLQDELTQLLKAYNEKEDMKIKSLVKIYENLDMNILLRVIDCMDQRKVAPILAFMSPESATAVTAAFANQKKLSEDVER